MGEIQQVQAIIDELERRRAENALDYFEPYGFQKKFLCPVDDQGNQAKQIALIAGNKTGKTYVGARAATYHATGLYPDWWTGEKFATPTTIWVAGNTIGNTRDLCQAELLGEPGDEDDFGRGSIPKHLIGRRTKYHGIPDALQTVLVKHVTGKWSKIIFKAFEQGKQAFMGKAVHYSWLDEEVPYDIYSQCIRASLKYGGIIGMTFTPESGMTGLVRKFMEERGLQQCFINATWDDALHLDVKIRQQLLDGLLPHEREMREKGIPVMGTGLIWPIAESKITCAPFAIPDSWPRIAGLDFAGSGSDGHPTALCAFAVDPSTGISYLYDIYRESGRTIPENWLYMSRVGGVPIAWPHDGLISDRGSPVSYMEQYLGQGANMLHNKFSNPPAPNMKEGSGGNGVKAGLTLMYSDMVGGQFKVFSNLVEWFEEFRQYYQKDGEVVKEGDDLMAASRYAYCSKRFAEAVFLIEDDEEDEYEYATQRNATTGY